MKYVYEDTLNATHVPCVMPLRQPNRLNGYGTMRIHSGTLNLTSEAKHLSL
ncbi:hypothetical protein AVEN_256160-1, partial [Araneus ventricosus]